MTDRKNLNKVHTKPITFVDPNYRPRYYQLPVFQARAQGINRFLLVWHRRAGKDKTCFELLLSNAFETAGNYWYMFPEYDQGRRAIWEAIGADGKRLLDTIPKALLYKKIPAQEMVIHLRTRKNIEGKDPDNHSIIRIVGADRPDTLAGANPVGVVCSEFALWKKPSTYYKIVEPILLENNGWVMFNSTARGKNHFYDLYLAAKGNPNWFVSNLSIMDTAKQNLDGEWVPVISKSDIEEIRKMGQTTEEDIQMEYFNSFETAPSDAFFAQSINFLTESGRINDNIHYDPRLKTYTTWDFGITGSTQTKPKDKTAVWVIQVGTRNGEVYFNILDYYENAYEGLSNVCKKIIQLPYTPFTKHIAPHDITKTNTDIGMGRAEIARNAGINFYDNQGRLHPAKKIRVEDRINILREFLPKCQFLASNTIDGRECLFNARSNWSQEERDRYSHGMDALSYFFVWWQQYGNSELNQLKIYPTSVNMGKSVFES